MRLKRITYIDNLRIFLIGLVVLHHLSITYGAPGGWYYFEGQAGPIASVILTLFVAANQSFFMGLLFFISAYFTNSSYRKNDAKLFLQKRIIRLGIPLVFFYFILSPITEYLPILFNAKSKISFSEFFISQKGFGFGPLWFVEALLAFTFIFAAYRTVTKSSSDEVKQPDKIPNNFKIIIFALFLGIITFITRLWLPIGWTLSPFEFQVAHFPQYISFFILGIMASNNHWLDSLNYRNCRKWFLFAQIMILFIFPMFLYLSGAVSGNLEPFMGGGHYQSFFYSLWEQFTGIALTIGILGLFQKRVNTQGKLGDLMSKSAYIVYIIHPPIVVLICLSVKAIELPLIYKFIIFALPVVGSCFLLAFLIRKIPIVKKIF